MFSWEEIVKEYREYVDYSSFYKKKHNIIVYPPSFLVKKGYRICVLDSDGNYVPVLVNDMTEEQKELVRRFDLKQYGRVFI